MPFKPSLAEKVFQSDGAACPPFIKLKTKANHALHEALEFRVDGAEIPIEPTNFIVLAVGVVISALGASYFVAHKQHWSAYRQQSERENILDLARSQKIDFGGCVQAFYAAVPA